MASNSSPGVMNKFVGQLRHVQRTVRRPACVCACPTGTVIHVSPEKFLLYASVTPLELPRYEP